MKEHRNKKMTQDYGDMHNHLPSLDDHGPWLILTRQNDDDPKLDNHTFCTTYDKSYTKTTISELQGKYILASTLGWLILQDRAHPLNYSLWNPLTQQCLLLPELSDPPDEEQHPYSCSILMSPPDDDPNHHHHHHHPCVLLLFFEGLMFSCMPIMSNRDNRDDECRWVKQSLQHDGRDLVVTRAATLNGDTYVYAIVYGHSTRILARVKVTVSDSSSILVLFETLEIEPPYNGIDNCRTYPHGGNYLVEARGALYAIRKVIRQAHEMNDYDIVKIYIWRLDLSQMSWIQVESLGDLALFLGPDCCTWCSADDLYSGIQGNCIYIVSSATGTMHQYHLQDDTYSFLFPSPDLHQTRDDTIWFMPHNPASSSICQLPSDMLISIMEYLHLFDSMSVRAACKTLRSKIPLPQQRPNRSHPLFMSRKNNKGGMCELWDPCQNKCYGRTIMTPYLSFNMVSTIEYCKDGWCLLRIDGESLQCVNPFEGKIYKYPSDELTFLPSSIAFSTCPTSPDCLTVGIQAYNNKVHVLYFRGGNERWDYKHIELRHDEGVEFQSNYNSSPMYHKGSFYFLGVNGDLAVLKMVDGEWSGKVHKGPTAEETPLNSCYLVELDTQLVSVFIEELGRRVQVFMFNTIEETWIAVHDLGDNMLFVSLGSSFSVSTTKDSSTRNTIFLPKRIGNEMVYYSLNSGMYNTSSNQHPSKNFYDMISHSFCCWL